jgi:hypothetical protein
VVASDPGCRPAVAGGECGAGVSFRFVMSHTIASALPPSPMISRAVEAPVAGLISATTIAAPSLAIASATPTTRAATSAGHGGDLSIKSSHGSPHFRTSAGEQYPRSSHPGSARQANCDSERGRTLR